MKENLKGLAIITIAFAILLLGQASPDEYGRLVFYGIPLNSLIFLAGGFICIFRAKSAAKVMLLMVPLILACAVSIWVHSPSEYGWLKSTNLMLSSFLAVVLFEAWMVEFSRDQLMLIWTGFLGVILVFALAYKARHGFFDLNVRFGLNGSIVFGRLMAFGLLCTALLQYKRWLTVVGVLGFSFGVVWSSSRAVLIFLIVVLLVGLFLKKISPRIALFALSALIVFSFGFSNIKNRRSVRSAIDTILHFDQTTDTLKREVAADKILTNFSHAFPGCIDRPPCVKGLNFGVSEVYLRPGDTRQIAWKMSTEMLKYPAVLVSGLGIGRWAALFEFYRYKYPHNIFLEVATELGLILGILFLIPFLYFFAKMNHPFSLLALMFLLFQQTSGDILDARYILVLSIMARLDSVGSGSSKAETWIRPGLSG